MFVVSEVIPDPLEDISKIFSDLWTKYIVNANVILISSSHNYKVLMYTYYPHLESYCEKTFPVLLRNFSAAESLTRFQYFPKKLSNMHGCPIKVASFHTEPFMMIDRQPNGTFELHGMDGYILKVLSQRICK